MTDDKRDEARARATPSRRIAAGKAPRFVHHPDPKSDPVEFLVENRFPGLRKAEEARRSTAVNVKTRWPSPSELYSKSSSPPPLKHASTAAYREELLTKSPEELSELCEQVQKQKE